jgi:hypothetical protein
MSVEELKVIGAQVEEALKDAAQSCVLTNQATKLRPGR